MSVIVLRITPLDIPEILELLFSYLDDHTIWRTVMGVCRLWCLVAQERVVREVTWHQGWSSARRRRAFLRLPGAYRFVVSCGGGRDQEALMRGIHQSLKSLEEDYRKQLKQWIKSRADNGNNSNSNNTSTTSASVTSGLNTLDCPHRCLKEMELFAADCDTYPFGCFSFPSTLTSLSITVKYGKHSEISLPWILSSCCPLLERFRLESNGVSVAPSLAACHLKSRILPRLSITSFPLQSLILQGIVFLQSDLENLLPFIPCLKELQLKAMLWSNNNCKYKWTRLFTSLRANNIILRKSHFSNLGKRMSIEESEMLLTEVYPQLSTERSFWALDITPQIFQVIFLQSNTLTTLEILSKPASSDYPRECCSRSLAETHSLIHHYLCDTPYLIHLTTLKTIVRLYDLDLFRRADYGCFYSSITREELTRASTVSFLDPLKIWRCRGLRTLHIDFHVPQTVEEEPAFSRVVFGYVSRVCPYLEDLEIGIQQVCHTRIEHGFYFRFCSHLSLQLQGGLCLLGRLKSLQRLRIFFDSGNATLRCKTWDLDWMVPSGRKEVMSKRKRRQEVESWKDLLDIENRAARSNNSDKGEYTVPGMDAKILSQLQNLGRLLDVEEMMKEMERKECLPMPSLEKVSFGLHIFMRPEDELERIFPSVLARLRSL